MSSIRKYLCLLLWLLVGPTTIALGCNEPKGQYTLTFKIRYREGASGYAKNGKTTIEKPAKNIPILLDSGLDNDLPPQQINTDDKGQLDTKLPRGDWEIKPFDPPPNNLITIVAADSSDNKIYVTCDGKKNKTFYIVLTKEEINNQTSITVQFKLIRAASFKIESAGTEADQRQGPIGQTSVTERVQSNPKENVDPAQGDLRIIKGRITDSSERPISGALVSLYVPAKIPARILSLGRVSTDGRGAYELRLTPDAIYEKYFISISHRLFHPKSVVLLWKEDPPQKIELERRSVASESQASLSIDFEATRRTVFLPQLMQTLPVPGLRSFDYFGSLAPGVSLPPESVGSAGPGVAPGVGTAGQFVINGLRSRENNFTLDGSDYNDEDIGTRRQGFVLLTPQPVESLQEFQVITALADARFGRNIGGQVNALTQSGSYGVHGQAYGFFTHDLFNARNFFDQKTDGAPERFILRRASDGAEVLLDNKPLVVSNPVGGEDKLLRVQYGMILGGQIKPLGAFLFGSYERLAVRATKESHFAVPTVAQRGIFNTGETGSFSVLGRIFPASVPGNAIFSLYPFPNNPQGPYGGNTYSAVLPSDANARRFSAKLSKQFGSYQKDRKFKFWRFLWAARGDAGTGRYNLTQEKSILPVTGGALFSSMRPRVRTQNVAVFINRTIAKNLTDTIRLSVGRTRLTFDEVRDGFLSNSTFFPDTPFLLNAPLLLNITEPILVGDILKPTTYVSASSPQGIALLNMLGYGSVKSAEEIAGPLGHVVIPGFSPLGVDASYFPQARSNNTFQAADTITYALRRHMWAFGFDVRKTQVNSTQDRGFRPQAVFNGLRASTAPYVPLFGPGGSPLPRRVFTGSTLAAMGAPTGLFQTLAVVPDSSVGLRFKQINLFVQDEWRVRPGLSLTLGVRYELNTVPGSDGQRLERALDPAELRSSLNQALPACIARLQNEEVCHNTVRTINSTFPPDFKLLLGADKNDLNIRLGFAWDPSGRGETVVRGGFGSYSGQFNGVILGQSRNVFPDFLPLNLAAFPYSVSVPGDTRTFLTNTANPILRQIDPNFNLIRNGTLNTLTAADPIAFLVNGVPFGPTLGLVLPRRELKTPYSYQYGITFEHVLWDDYLVSVAYVGTRGGKLLRLSTPEKGVNLSRFELAVVRPVGRQSPQTPFPIFSGLLLAPQDEFVKSHVHIAPTFFESSASSTYNSLQMEVRKRYSQRFQFGTVLTYSHSIDDASDYFDTAGAFALPQSSLLRSERGPSSFDVRFRSATNFVVDLPWKWQASGILMAQTGQPFTVNTIFDINRDGNLTDRLNSTSGIVTDPIEGDRSVQLGLALGTDPMSLLALDGEDGSVGRNTFRARSTVTFDLSFLRTFNFSAERQFQFRTEIFNLFNRANFGIPERILESPAFGKSVRTTTPARMIQFGFKFLF
jgi:hypothetical protein